MWWMIVVYLLSPPSPVFFDRVEPPYAVLIADDGASLDVLVSELPLGALPGDVLASPRGPILPGREARLARVMALQQALRDLPVTPGSVLVEAEPTTALETTPSLGQGSPMNRRQPDAFSRRAQREGFRARSVYKLEEIDDRASLFRAGQRVLDLGCAPGSWLQYVAKKVGPRGKVVGIDQQPVKDFGLPQVTVLQGDVGTIAPEALIALGGPFDAVISDMAPWTSGNRFTDHVRSVGLCRRALELAEATLVSGGRFVCKVFEGEDEPPFFMDVKARFSQARRIKPKGTRSESVELFIVAEGYLGSFKAEKPAQTPPSIADGSE